MTIADRRADKTTLFDFLELVRFSGTRPVKLSEVMVACECRHSRQIATPIRSSELQADTT